MVCFAGKPTAAATGHLHRVVFACQAHHTLPKPAQTSLAESHALAALASRLQMVSMDWAPQVLKTTAITTCTGSFVGRSTVLGIGLRRKDVKSKRGLLSQWTIKASLVEFRALAGSGLHLRTVWTTWVARAQRTTVHTADMVSFAARRMDLAIGCHQKDAANSQAFPLLRTIVAGTTASAEPNALLSTALDNGLLEAALRLAGAVLY